MSDNFLCSKTMQQWASALEYLKAAEESYSGIGRAGAFALVHVIMPLRDRVESGERSDELYDEIMGVSL